jgi:YbgC/YbaW family acyl-CoA thioester hydrolase
MTYESRITVRGYELDSFGHVNNAVYLNYCEHARWEILGKKNLLEFFSTRALILVVVEANIRYIKEAKPFDELLVRTGMERRAPYLVFNHVIGHATADEVIARARIKTVLVDKDSIPHDIPDFFTE